MKKSLNYPVTLDQTVLQLVWQGFGIYLNNKRGIHILLQAIAVCKSKVLLTLQGYINNEQAGILNNYLNELHIENIVCLVPPAPPDSIVESLLNYDVGLIGEIPEEDNQRLTSSNKLFDYINAGLAVISPDIPGLNETLDEFNVGLKYEAGNVQALSAAIDFLATDPVQLNRFKKASKEAAAASLYWEADYDPLIRYLISDERS